MMHWRLLDLSYESGLSAVALTSGAMGVIWRPLGEGGLSMFHLLVLLVEVYIKAKTDFSFWRRW